MSIINKAVSWAADIAADDTHGYSQANREGNPDYDCSSFVCYAFSHAGLNTRPNYTPSTREMYQVFLAAGFKDVTNKVNFETGSGMLKGDVLLTPAQHTEIYYSSGQLVGAHTDYGNPQAGDQNGKEISIVNYYNYPWTYCLRYEEAPTITKDDLNVGNRYLTLSEMTPNAQYVLNFLCDKGWTKESVCAVLGNMQTESNINPQLWESLNQGNMSGGFGLVQWTPATNLIDWANSKGYDYNDIDTQLLKLIDELNNGGQWYPTSQYSMTFREFVNSTESPDYLAKVFIHNYERPASYVTENKRGEDALYWYNLLTVGGNGGESGGGSGGTGGGESSGVDNSGGTDTNPSVFDWSIVGVDINNVSYTLTISSINWSKITLVGYDEKFNPINSIYKMVLESSFNEKCLKKENIIILKSIEIDDLIKMNFKYWHTKCKIGYNFTKSRLTFTTLSYKIKNVEKNGFICCGVNTTTLYNYLHPNTVKLDNDYMTSKYARLQKLLDQKIKILQNYLQQKIDEAIREHEREEAEKEEDKENVYV